MLKKCHTAAAVWPYPQCSVTFQQCFCTRPKQLMEWGTKQQFCIMELYLKNCPSKARRVNAAMN